MRGIARETKQNEP